MYIKNKAMLLAALILSTASEAASADGLDIHQVTIHSTQHWSALRRHSQTRAKAFASDHGRLDWASVHPESAISRKPGAPRQPGANVAPCPWWEGYPDCHPDAQSD